MDYIQNGVAHGNLAAMLLRNGFDMRVARPWVDEKGRVWMARIDNGKEVAVPVYGNSSATLRREEWKEIDAVVVKAARLRLKAIQDLRGAGLVYCVPNGMGKTVLETERMSRMNEAIVSMDALRGSVQDRPHFDITHLPLPIISKDFEFTARQLAVSRNGNTPLDMTAADEAGRAVAEVAEQFLIGTLNYAYGSNGTLYGYTNFPQANTQDITAPTETGWTPATLISEVLQMRQKSIDDLHYGPWVLYFSKDWDVYLDQDYSTIKGDWTLRNRLKQIDGLTNVASLDFLTGTYKVLLIQMTADVVRLIEGMDVTTIQWESHGGLLVHFKVMAIMVPQLRADFNGNTGIVYGAPA